MQKSNCNQDNFLLVWSRASVLDSVRHHAIPINHPEWLSLSFTCLNPDYLVFPRQRLVDLKDRGCILQILVLKQIMILKLFNYLRIILYQLLTPGSSKFLHNLDPPPIISYFRIIHINCKIDITFSILKFLQTI